MDTESRTIFDRVESLSPPGQIEPLGRKQLADWLGVTVRTIDTWRKSEGLPFHKSGGRVEFERAEVDSWLRQRWRLLRLRMAEGSRLKRKNRINRACRSRGLDAGTGSVIAEAKEAG